MERLGARSRRRTVCRAAGWELFDESSARGPDPVLEARGTRQRRQNVVRSARDTSCPSW